MLEPLQQLGLPARIDGRCRRGCPESSAPCQCQGIKTSCTAKPDSNAAKDSQACLKGRVGSLCVAATPYATLRASVCRQHADDTLTESPFRHRRRSDTDAVLLPNSTSNWTRVIDLGFQSYSVNARPAKMLPLTCHPTCVPML